MDTVDPAQVLREARGFVRSEQYAEALEKYLWFHEHAVEIDPAFTGVRLSYALNEWAHLGDVYPPARAALANVRDAKAESLLKANGDAGLFTDVESINRVLEQREQTRELFTSIGRANRKLAEQCFHVALESLVEAKDFSLARSFLSDPRKEIDRAAKPLNLVLQWEPVGDPEEERESFVAIYVGMVSLICAVLAGVNEELDADLLRDYAANCVRDEHGRDMVMRRLYLSSAKAGIQ